MTAKTQDNQPLEVCQDSYVEPNPSRLEVGLEIKPSNEYYSFRLVWWSNHKQLLYFVVGWENYSANHHGIGFDIQVWCWEFGLRLYPSLTIGKAPVLDDRE